jgi:Fe-S cluster assembly iron-binding protein IscA
VKVWVYAGGTSGVTYKVTVLATTNDSRVKEAELKVKIKEV